MKEVMDITREIALELTRETGKEKNSILVVDDDDVNLSVLMRILQSEYRLYAASDGKSAIYLAEECMPDLILMDVIMPQIDGYKTFELMRQSEKIKNIPVIFITGLNNTDDEKKGLSLGAVDYIHKPYDNIVVKMRIDLHMKIINQLRTIEYLSTIDPLVKIPNRRAFNGRLVSEWGRAVRQSEPISAIMIDVDFFKKINDDYGHLQGDRVLCKVADVIKSSIRRSTDFVARWGGEEFIVLLPNTKKDAASVIAETIRKNVEVSEIPLCCCCDDNDTKIKATISAGINTQIPNKESSMSRFISYADTALYTAKENGRNRVCVYEG